MPNPVIHFEIGCSDRVKTQAFFGKLFDWQMQDVGPATMISTGGIGGHMTALGHEPHHYTIFYVQVDDVQAYLDKAPALGGKMLVPPVDISTRHFRLVRRSREQHHRTIQAQSINRSRKSNLQPTARGMV